MLNNHTTSDRTNQQPTDEEIINQLIETDEGDVVPCTVAESEGGEGLSPRDVFCAISRDSKSTHVDDVYLQGEEATTGLKRYYLYVPQESMHFIIRYGHRDRAVDRGMRVVQKGEKVRAENRTEFTPEKMDEIHKELDDERLNELKEAAETQLEVDDMVVESLLIERGELYRYDMSDNYIKFTLERPSYWFYYDELKSCVQEIAEEKDWAERGVFREVKVAITRGGEKEFCYKIELESR
jgi:hypothetical protein